jgi:hypothetical protein
MNKSVGKISGMILTTAGQSTWARPVPLSQLQHTPHTSLGSKLKQPRWVPEPLSTSTVSAGFKSRLVSSGCISSLALDCKVVASLSVLALFSPLFQTPQLLLLLQWNRVLSEQMYAGLRYKSVLHFKLKKKSCILLGESQKEFTKNMSE